VKEYMLIEKNTKVALMKLLNILMGIYCAKIFP
jgi:hypothetical protein